MAIRNNDCFLIETIILPRLAESIHCVCDFPLAVYCSHTLTCSHFASVMPFQ